MGYRINNIMLYAIKLTNKPTDTTTKTITKGNHQSPTWQPKNLNPWRSKQQYTYIYIVFGNVPKTVNEEKKIIIIIIIIIVRMIFIIIIPYINIRTTTSYLSHSIYIVHIDLMLQNDVATNKTMMLWLNINVNQSITFSFSQRPANSTAVYWISYRF